MRLPFTIDQFLGVFGDYNRAFWPVAVVLWLASAALLAAAWRRPAEWSRALATLLALQWLWSGLAYHALLFTTINPAAWLFAALFVLQSWLLWQRRRDVPYFSGPGARNAIGFSLSLYALAYPVLGLMLHRYPYAPTFAVPCPTAILTIGVLMTARVHELSLVTIPVLWGLIGGSAAVLLEVPQDFVLLASATGLVIAVMAGTRHSRRSPRT